jgi:hypothetical protein
MGGYWLSFARDGRDQIVVPGWSMTDAILWQPRFGHSSRGEMDVLGMAFDPLIQADRRWIHKSHYLVDTNFDAWMQHLPLSQVHPRWQDSYVTKVTTKVSRDVVNGALKLTFRLTGSDRPRELTELKLRKNLAETLDVSAPAGFVVQPYQYAWSSNRYIRWVSKIPLPRDRDVLVIIPAKKSNEGSGYIDFKYHYADRSEDWYSLGRINLPQN